MQNDTKAALGIGAATLAGSLYGQVKGIGRAAQAMNAQIDRDLHALGATGHLPDTKSVLPLTVRPRSKVLILLTSMLAGFLIVAGLTALVGSALVENDAPTPLVRALEVLVGSTIMGVLVGWVPGAIITIVRFQRDNVRRAQAQVIKCYAAYWAERQSAQAALRDRTVKPVEVAQSLVTHVLDIEA